MQDIRKEFKGREVFIPGVGKIEKEAPSEKFPEKVTEIPERVLQSPQIQTAATPVPNAVSLQNPAAILPLQSSIENILQEDLVDLYKELSPAERVGFKNKGEEVSRTITQLVKAVQVKIQDIINLIKEWLKMLPGVKDYFIEQEAKIKAEKILKLKK